MKTIQLEMAPETLKEIDKIVKLIDVKSRGELIRHALSFYRFCAKETGLGKKLLLRAEDGSEQEVSLL